MIRGGRDGTANPRSRICLIRSIVSYLLDFKILEKGASKLMLTGEILFVDKVGAVAALRQSNTVESIYTEASKIYLN